MKCYVQLGKNGDILSILPILYHEFQKTGQVQVLMVAKEFAPLLSGVSYVRPFVFDGLFDDARTAVKIAKQNYSEVVNLQHHGNIPFQQTSPSFQHDQWKRAGAIDGFDLWPLVIDQRNGLRERILYSTTINRLPTKRRPFEKYILFADYSQSSPFPQKEELATMLKKEFGEDYRILRLSEVRATRLFDILRLYEDAACLVTVETSHVHLSGASAVPTIVLAANGWRGSAYRSRYQFYCRYSEWERRKRNLIFAVDDAIRSRAKPKIHLVKTGFPNAYNLSEIRWQGRLFRSYRHHPEENWKTQLVIDDGDCYCILKCPSLRGFSVEDARFFIHQERLHISYTVATARSNQFFCATGYGELKNSGDGWSLEGHTIPAYAGNDFSGMQKNWCPFEHEGKLHFIYGNRENNQIVLQMDGERVGAVHKSPSPKWAWGEIRGGAVISNQGRMFRFFHSRQNYEDKTFRYFVGCSVLESKPPFATLSISSSPILEGNEQYTHCAHWKRNVVFPLGCVMGGDKFLLSVGLNDSRCAVVELSEKDLKL